MADSVIRKTKKGRPYVTAAGITSAGSKNSAHRVNKTFASQYNEGFKAGMRVAAARYHKGKTAKKKA